MARPPACTPLPRVRLQDKTASGYEMHKVLGPFSLVMLGIGCIIGAGVFVLTGVAARKYAG